MQVVQIESVANEQQETPDAIDVEAESESDQEFAERGESEEPDERPAVISALKERPHRERRPPEKSPEPHISPRKCGGRKSSPAGKKARGRKRERKTDKSETRVGLIQRVQSGTRATRISSQMALLTTTNQSRRAPPKVCANICIFLRMVFCLLCSHMSCDVPRRRYQ